ncbi:MAG: putative lipid II flippase FtsW [Candidatus Nanopelagicales bacterium]|jgi:cell division protein FtsW|nr:putative lipid II flippase FtsW [Candidatus Nanopelagicales bacterium]MDP4666895.1 putative lipid II flippase FtsW [Candidatus Nanopelagicales bacterium]MDP4895751.1 putative lipid II flippase FtsW [Candidatus Nanopelagicales bacterium]MDP5050243.1 putative lipid II flippase FtsW [Candidatus Nanopelagicales bacterium]
MTTKRSVKERNFEGGLAARLEHPMVHYQILLGATGFLLTMGVVMVASSSSVFSYQQNDGNSWALATRQLIFAALGVFLMMAVSKMHVDSIRRWATLFMLGVGILLIAVLIIGTARYGQKNWIEFGGPFRIQPSEFAKLAVVLWGADILDKKYHLLEQRNHLLVPLVPVCLTVLVLIMLQGDLGTAMVMMPIMASLLYFVGAPRKWFVAMALAALSAIAALSIAAPYRMARFTSWLDPFADAQGTGFQVIRGQQALGSGGWWGVGLGGSREKWGTLPEAHTDFIYAVIGEELGILGTMTVLLLFVTIAVIGLRIARGTNEAFIQIAALGIVTWIIVQALVNIGAVLGILPITGVPLPMVSYGGSSLIPSLVAMGVLMSFAKHEAVMQSQRQ